MRTLESWAQSGPGPGDTRIFITPGFAFQVVDLLVTNFHLPKSTLMMLVSAFAGYEHIMLLYRHAIAQRYRFFSYGDAMLLQRTREGQTPERFCRFPFSNGGAIREGDDASAAGRPRAASAGLGCAGFMRRAPFTQKTVAHYAGAFGRLLTPPWRAPTVCAMAAQPSTRSAQQHLQRTR